MTESEFIRQSQAAVDRMRDMNARSKITENSQHKMPPSPSFVKVNANSTTNEKNITPEKTVEKNKYQNEKPTINNGFGIPILNNILKDGDSALILGLLLILMSENTDKILLFALIYILT